MASQAVLSLIAELHDNASAGMASIGDAAGKLGMIAGGVALAGVAALGAALVDGIGAARESALLNAQTEQTIASMGNAAGVSSQHVQDLASSLSDAAGLSLFGDDQIQAATNMLLTFENIKGATLDLATALTVDMAQALHKTPEDLSVMIGKLLNSSDAMSAAQRMGVSFTDEQVKMGKAMFEAGNIAGYQQLVMSELNKEFGGQAAAAAKAEGGMAQFKGILGETTETLGRLLLPVLNTLFQHVLLPGIQTLAQVVNAVSGDKAAFEGLTPTLQNLVNGIQQVIAFIATVIQSFQSGGQGANVMGGVLQTFGGVVSWLGGVWQALQPVVTNVVNALGNVIQAVFGVVQAFMQAHGAQISAFMTDAWTRIQQIIRLSIELYNAIVPPVLNIIAGLIRDHGATIQAVLGAAWQAISGLIDAALTLIQGLLQTALQLISGDWAGAWQTIQDMSARIVQDLWQVISAGFDAIVAIVADFGPIVLGYFDDLARDLVAAGAALIDGIKQGVSDAWNDFMGWLHDKMMEIPEPIRDALRISSPSEVMADLVGRPLVEGIVKGIYDTFPLIDSAMAAVGGRIEESLRGVQQLAHDIINDIIDSSVSTTRQAVANFDALQRLATQAEAEKKRTDAAILDASAALQAAFTSGDQAKIAEAMKNYDTAMRANGDAIAALQSIQVTQQQARIALAQAQAQAAEISATNAQAGADYLAMRSRQIFELTALEGEKAAALAQGNTAEAAILAQKITLVKQAQDAELAQFQQHAGDLAQQLAQRAADIAQQGATAGDGFIQGVIAGIAGQTQALSDAMIAAVSAAIAAMRRALGIASPSKIMEMQIGVPMMQGMALGIAGGAPLAVQAMERASSSVVNAGQTTNNYYAMSYETRQSSGSVAQDVELLSLLYA